MNLFIRNKSKKGIKIVSLEDGTSLGETSQIHANPIMDFLICKDGATIISAGKDKKIKVWNWVNDKLIETLSGHVGNVNALCISPNEDYLISGSDD